MTRCFSTIWKCPFQAITPWPLSITPTRLPPSHMGLAATSPHTLSLHPTEWLVELELQPWGSYWCGRAVCLGEYWLMPPVLLSVLPGCWKRIAQLSSLLACFAVPCSGIAPRLFFLTRL